MHVDKQIIKLWGIDEVSNILKSHNVSFRKHFGYRDEVDGVPIFVLEELKKG